MGRIRTIKPEFPQSESMGRVSRDARLTFILLWTLADDSGRLRGNSRMLASLLFPYDEDSRGLDEDSRGLDEDSRGLDEDSTSGIEKWLSELAREGCLTRYEVDGNSYIQVRNWCQHQRIDRPTKSKIPPPREDSSNNHELSSKAREDSSKARESSCEDLRIKDQGSKDQRTARDASSNLKSALSDLGPEWVSCAADLVQWQAHLTRHGKTPIDPDLAAFNSARMFSKPSQLKSAIKIAMGNDWVTLRPSMAVDDEDAEPESEYPPFEPVR